MLSLIHEFPRRCAPFWAALVVLCLAACLAVSARAERRNLITDPDAWTLQKNGDADATLTRGDDGLKVIVSKADGTDWHCILMQTGVEVREGQSYALSFRARADAPRPLLVRAALAQPDFHDIGLSRNITLGTDWQTYQMPFTAWRVVPGHTAVPEFLLGTATGTVWFRDITLVARAAPRQAAPAAAPRPPRGEISLSGSIRSLSAPRGPFVMWVTQVVTPTGPPQDFDPPRRKTVRLASPPPKSLHPGDSVTVVGPDGGAGAVLTARRVRVGAP